MGGAGAPLTTVSPLDSIKGGEFLDFLTNFKNTPVHRAGYPVE
jgi:hypothetical protein